ncbi:MAG TPA: DUF2000 domain-containing protein [Streptosporangiaceae bacterium]|nr:DUF2000 domain-containing protein [Streptosporangiaceae bacterium]
MRFDTKIAIVVRAELAVWQKLNVTAFLASGIAAANPDIIGKRYEDGTGNAYLELFRQPVLIYAGEAADLSVVHRRALERDLRMAVYTIEMFGTGNDDDNRAVVRAATELDLAGVALYGPRNVVDKVVKGVSLHT